MRSTVILAALLLIVTLVRCVTPSTPAPPTVTASPSSTLSPPTPTPTRVPTIPLTEPPARYPRSQNDATPHGVVERAARHLAGWLHAPVEEIRFVRVESAPTPPSVPAICATRWQTPDESSPGPTAAGQRIIFQVGEKQYGYYTVGDALLLCPATLP